MTPDWQKRIDAAMANAACTEVLAYVPYQDPERTYSEEEANRRALAFLRSNTSKHVPIAHKPIGIPRGNIIQGPWA